MVDYHVILEISNTEYRDVAVMQFQNYMVFNHVILEIHHVIPEIHVHSFLYFWNCMVEYHVIPEIQHVILETSNTEISQLWYVGMAWLSTM